MSLFTTVINIRYLNDLVKELTGREGTWIKNEAYFPKSYLIHHNLSQTFTLDYS